MGRECLDLADTLEYLGLVLVKGDRVAKLTFAIQICMIHRAALILNNVAVYKLLACFHYCFRSIKITLTCLAKVDDQNIATQSNKFSLGSLSLVVTHHHKARPFFWLGHVIGECCVRGIDDCSCIMQRVGCPVRQFMCNTKRLPLLVSLKFKSACNSRSFCMVVEMVDNPK